MPKLDNRPLTFDHLRGKKQPNRKSVRIPLDSDVADRYDNASNKFELLQFMAKASPDDLTVMEDLKVASKEYDEAKTAIEGASVKFIFKSIGRKPFEKLKAAHPRTAQQLKEDEKEGRPKGALYFNHDTFPQAIVAAASVNPLLTEEDTNEMWDDPNWSEAELALLFSKAMEANEEQRVVDLGKG